MAASHNAPLLPACNHPSFPRKRESTAAADPCLQPQAIYPIAYDPLVPLLHRSPPSRTNQRCLGIDRGEHRLVWRAVAAREAGPRRIVDLGVQLRRPSGVARITHDTERRAHGDQLVGSEGLNRRLVLEVTEEDEVPRLLASVLYSQTKLP